MRTTLLSVLKQPNHSHEPTTFSTDAMAEGLAAEQQQQQNARLMDKALKQGVCALALSQPFSCRFSLPALIAFGRATTRMRQQQG